VFLAGYGAYVLLARELRTFRVTAWRDAAAGALGGVAGGFAGFPGLVVTIWCSMRGGDNLAQRAVYQPYILAMQLVTFACLGWGAPARMQATPAMGFVPFALLGAMGGLALFQRLSAMQFRVALGGLLAASGAGLLARAM
jgi:hypothetical protein